jgi:hypothetical protein
LVKQLPVEMHQQSSNASSCMRTRIVIEEHYCKPFSEWPYAVRLALRNILLILLLSLVA